MRRRAAVSVALATLLVATRTPQARAQLCGDADLDGGVTVADGVRVLRAAAARFDDECPPLVCDVDQDGLTTAGDGRLALRKAAGLPIAERCGTGSLGGTLAIPETAAAGGAVREREPNDAATVAQAVGVVAAGEAWTIAGAVDGSDDAFDGYRLVARARVTLDLLLRFEAAPDVDLDLLIDDGSHDEATVTCEGTTPGLEACAVTVGSGDAPRAADVVVVPAAGSRPVAYTLEVRGRGPEERGALLAAGAGAGVSIDVAVAAYRGTEADFVPGELVVQIAPAGPTAADPFHAGAAVAASAARAGMTDDVETVAEDAAGAVLLRIRPAAPTAEARAAPGTGTDRAAAKRARGAAREQTRVVVARLAAQADIAFAHPNYIAHAARVPNDELFTRQWHYELIGLPRTWSLEIGRETVVVAVVDTGVRDDHPDLRGKLVAGYDFVGDPERANDGDGIDPDPFDPGDRIGVTLTGSFHGTHIAGTIGAATDNDEGVAGVAWRTRIMALRVLGIGGGTAFDIAQAIKFAAGLPNVSGTLPARSARVINMSLTALGDVATLRNAVDQATAAGALVVAASGNTASDALLSPAAFENSLTVAATDVLGAIAPYSNFGPQIDLAAPGGHTRVDLNGDGFPDGVFSTLLGGDRAYAYFQGTSMACAHVSGVAALLLAGRAALSPAELRHALEDTAQDRGAPGRDDRYGRGLVDPTRAFQAVTGARAPTLPLLALDTLTLAFAADRSALAVRASNAGGGTFEVHDTVPDTDDGAPWLGARFDVPTASVAITVNRVGLAPGTYGGRVAVASNGGNERIRITMTVAPAGGIDVGPVRVHLLDPGTGSVRAELATDAAQGYGYRFEGLPAGPYEIFAGTDRDDDGSICDAGELCGAFPVLSQPEAVTVVGGEALEARDFPLNFVATAAGPRASP